MGAEQSSNRDQPNHQGDHDNDGKTCYYEALEIARDASEDEIKKAYRKKALELHPDRNYGDVEEATKRFAEVQAAYEILSDPQERAWYDTHRDAILRGGDVSEDHFEYNVRLTSSGDLVNLISKFSKKLPFTDASNGFYGILRTTFANLAREEQEACAWEGLQSVQYPDFGTADDSYDDIVKPFYAIWLGFNTRKTYSWKAQYRYSEAPDRRVRRAMEKENKRLCDEGIREFNDAVRTLVAFARKRDPRYIANAQSEADRQKILREAAATQAARSRAANQAKINSHVVPSWARPQVSADEHELSSEDEQTIEEQFECVVCGKTFKSERQYEAHEKSKKHIKAIQQLKWQMQKDNKLLNLDDTTSSSDTTATPCEAAVATHGIDAISEYTETPSSPHVVHHDKLLTPNSASPAETFSLHPAIKSDSEAASESDHTNDEYTSRVEVEKRFSGLTVLESVDDRNPVIDNQTEEHQMRVSGSVGEDDGSPGKTSQKLGKAKLKRVRKAAQQETALQDSVQFTCMKCNQQFNSKTKLFGHIRDMDHAQPVSKKGVKGTNR